MERERVRQPINVGDITIKPDELTVMAGVCAVESEKQTMSTAKHVVTQGADILRGGAFKPRTSPDSFQGLGLEGLRILFEAGRIYEIPVVTEVMEKGQIGSIREAARGHPFIFQIGTRNAQNYPLLTAVGETGYPVLLKRGRGAKVTEMISAAQYVMRGGSPVIMCERGIATHSDVGRNTPDLNAIFKFQEKGFLAVLDPSHAAGRNDWAMRLALAGVAAGSDGILVEVNPTCDALCDGNQALSFEQFTALMDTIRGISSILQIQKRNIERVNALA